MNIFSNELFVNNLDSDDAGVYTCVATNDAGEDTYDFTLDVGSQATINSDISHVRPEIGLSVALDCPISGYPTPDVIWFRDNVRLKDDQKRITISDDQSRLEIDGLEIFDEGVYTCKASVDNTKIKPIVFVFAKQA